MQDVGDEVPVDQDVRSASDLVVHQNGTYRRCESRLVLNGSLPDSMAHSCAPEVSAALLADERTHVVFLTSVSAQGRELWISRTACISPELLGEAARA